MEKTTTIQEKSEILFLYESTYSIPNGDPFTGEQRYDDETKNILVSDVRIKRFIRDYLDINGNEIYVKAKEKSFQYNASDSEEKNSKEGDKSAKEDKSDKKKASGSARRIDELIDKFKGEIENAKKKNKKLSEALYVLRKCIDVRLFGGISTKEKDAVNLTGPVQFSLLNPSLNQVNLRMHQNTSHFESSEEKKQGAIGTTTVVPYAVVQIHGWVNPKIAEQTGLTQDDLNKMYQAIWYGTSGDGSSHSRSKVGQNSLLLLQIVYADSNKKIYGADKLIQVDGRNGKKDEQWRGLGDFQLKIDKLIDAAKSDKIKEIRYYSEIDNINQLFKGKDKFKFLTLDKI